MIPKDLHVMSAASTAENIVVIAVAVTTMAIEPRFSPVLQYLRREDLFLHIVELNTPYLWIFLVILQYIINKSAC